MLLELKNITKKFGEIGVLKGINLGIFSGEIIGLVGENGAGKSTLMNILGGIFEQSTGEMLIENQKYNPQTPKDTKRLGIEFIHQELNLFSNLSIYENIFITQLPQKMILGLNFIDHAEAIRKAEILLNQVGLQVSPKALIEDLTAAQKQLVEIAKALSGSPRIIIFDEPTTSLTRFEADKLFELMAQLKTRQIAIVYISHNLADVLELSDKICVMRDGVLVKNISKTDGFNKNEIIKAMIGREMSQFFPSRTSHVKEEIILRVQALEAEEMVKNVSFELNKGEVLGFYGLIGAGRSEIARLIFGLDKLKNGKISFKNEEILSPNPQFWIKKGMAFLTENRREEGILLAQTIEKNISLPSFKAFKTAFFNQINFNDLGKAVAKMAQKIQIKSHSIRHQEAGTLSGGNQQKVVLSKWLITKPEVLIIDEPTKGIDIGAKHEIYSLINEIVEEGKSVLMISSEIEELLGMCDRILVMNAGSITAEFKKNEFNRNEILAAAIHQN